MPLEDAERWDARYRADPRFNSFIEPRPFLVEQAGLLPRQGLALDAAMGLGGNASYLLEHGLDVVGVDISGEAVRRARQRLPALMAVQADLTRFFLPRRAFDVILNFYYLQRDLWPEYVRALRPGGILIFESLTTEMLSLDPQRDPAYLLAPGELQAGFRGLETLVYREGWTESDTGYKRAVACIAARRPG